MKKQKKICICLAHNYHSFSKEFTLSLLTMQHYFYEWERKAKRNDLLSTIVQGGYQLDWMRNEVARVALNTNQDILLFLDTDMDFPAETIPRMLMVLEQNEKDGYNAVSGLYCHKRPPFMPLMYHQFDEATHSYAGAGGGFPLNAPFPIAASGAGILMVKAEVFKNSPQPWFRFVKEGEMEELPRGLGEDLYFFWHCKPKTLLDPTIMCGHYNNVASSLKTYVEYNDLNIVNNQIKVTQKRLDEIKTKHDLEEQKKAVEQCEQMTKNGCGVQKY